MDRHQRQTGCSSAVTKVAIMLNPQKTLDREALLKRSRELDAEIAQHERNLREGEARLPIEEQLRLNLQRLIEASLPEMAGKIEVTARPHNTVTRR